MTAGRTETRQLDILGELPAPGTTLIEADAGTGKTYTLVALATRFLAEGVVDAEHLMLVTFSRAATRELQERMRLRLVQTLRGLEAPPAADVAADPVVELLRAGTAEQVAARRDRLAAALGNFDAATIVTTHAFCRRMLDGLGAIGAGESDGSTRTDLTELTREIVDDLYLRTYARSAEPPPFDRRAASAIAEAAMRDRQAALAPTDVDGTDAAERVAFAAAAREELRRRKAMSGIRDFEDLQEALLERITDPASGTEAVRRIRERFTVVLVDEFQDTDDRQWEILRTAFGAGGDANRLILVADPKQAIYAFRGADIFSYLRARNDAVDGGALTTNRRTDQLLIAGLDHLQGGAELGNPEIVVGRPGAHRTRSRLIDPATGAAPAPLVLRMLGRDAARAPADREFPPVADMRAAVAADVARRIVELLDRTERRTDGDATEPLSPGDIAVLVRTHGQVAAVREHLDAVGVPSVPIGGTSVYATDAARWWLAVLQAVEQPARNGLVRLAALTPVFGYTPADLDRDPDGIVARVADELIAAARLIERVGYSAALERLALVGDVPLASRLLRLSSGGRDITDLRHIAELLDTDGPIPPVPTAVRRLERRIAEPESAGDERIRRLDSDADAVQLATIHATKGLEFPVVCLPYLWDAARNPKPETMVLHDGSRQRLLDVGGWQAPGAAQRSGSATAEMDGEDLRLMYVGLTRAESRVILWWAPSVVTAKSPLHRMLSRPAQSPTVPADALLPSTDDAVDAVLRRWAREGPEGAIAIERLRGEPAEAVTWQPPTPPVDRLRAARFDRTVDTTWRRLSYTSLTAGAHAAPAEAERPAVVIDEPAPAEEVEIDRDDIPVEDPPALVAEVIDDPDVPARFRSPMADLPAGADFGVVVHEVLQFIDTSADDLRAEVARSCAQAQREGGLEVDVEALADALTAVLRTPLGAGAETLAAVGPSDRLSEMEFELPLAGSAPDGRPITIASIARLMRRMLPADDPLAAYPDHLARLEPTRLRGYLTGSIDSVLRLPGPRFVVVDYKTNRVGGEAVDIRGYDGAAMADEMIRSHYPLQAILYAVALHRYLRWRLPGYDPIRHLGGMKYLFVRAMVGADTPDDLGVFTWEPPAELVVALSDLLGGRR
ncbi:UvrD-helicase domain-containing protein [Millisia brevis]|uniref:UvrD-helicase domain-containing protein n=1 Tax=Millisia brevis TaxID=264148 RepID=UPI00082D3776|nr:UvrD-helicase domain-containing protein [Millisia brevis]